jgi:hypothetical protein
LTHLMTDPIVSLWNNAANCEISDFDIIFHITKVAAVMFRTCVLQTISIRQIASSPIGMTSSL